ncbi:MAG: hypothetical protein AB1499_02520 [Nitrospirota bacterium]
MEIPLLFGRYLVRHGKITEEQLSDATKAQNEINKAFAVIAIENDFITLDDLKKALAFQRKEGIRFREALLRLQIADDKTIEEIDKTVVEKSVKLGEILVIRGLLEENELNNILNEFKEKGTLELL